MDNQPKRKKVIFVILLLLLIVAICLLVYFLFRFLKPRLNMPNITMQGSFHVGQPLAVNQPIPISFTIINNGSAPANPVEYLYTNQSDGYSTTKPEFSCHAGTILNPGQTCVVAYSFHFPTPGNKTMTVELDSNHRVNESNENDNTFSVNFTIPSP